MLFHSSTGMPVVARLAGEAEAGETWWLTGPEWEGIAVDAVRRVIQEGPSR